MSAAANRAEKNAHQRLRAFHQGAHAFVAVGGIRIGGHVGELLLYSFIDLLAGLLKERLIKVAISHLPRQVADGRELSVAHDDHPVEEGAQRFLGVRRKGSGRTGDAAPELP